MRIQNVTDKLRALVSDVLTSTRADGFKPARVLREALGTANDLVGRPFASVEELSARRHIAHPVAVAAAPARREPAPVMVYFDGKDHRTKKKVEEVLGSREVPFTLLDVTDDEATRTWALAAAKQAEFPLVFIAGEAVGGLHELTQLDVNGELKRRVFGA